MEVDQEKPVGNIEIPTGDQVTENQCNTENEQPLPPPPAENNEKAEDNPGSDVPASQDKPEEVKPDTNEEMSAREKDLLDTVFQLESDKLALIEETRTKLAQAKRDYEELRTENEKLKKKILIMEQNLVQKEAAQSPGTKSKQEQEDVLMKAKTLLFEKTKICKQQEQHIEMLKTQVESIKEVLAVTKEMQNLKNTEIEHLQDRLKNLDICRKTQKEHNDLVTKKLNMSQDAYQKLRAEYDTQAQIYKELKVNYLLKIQLLTDELAKVKGGPPPAEVNGKQ